MKTLLLLLKRQQQLEINVGSRPLCKYLHKGRYAKYRIMQSDSCASQSLSWFHGIERLASFA